MEGKEHERHIAAKRRSCLVASCQGLTVRENINVGLDYALVKHADKNTFVMLTNRTTESLHFYGVLSKKERTLLAANTVITKFLAGKVQKITDLFAEELKGLKVITSPLKDVVRQGGDAGTQRTRRRNMLKRLNKAQTAYELAKHEETADIHDDDWVPGYLRASITHVEEHLVKETSGPEEAPRDLPARTHWAAPALKELMDNAMTNLNRYTREVWVRGQWSNQFADVRDIMGPDGMPYAAAVATHSASDETAIPFSKKKRLPLSTVRNNKLEFLKSQTLGKHLFQAYAEQMNLGPEGRPFDVNRYAECVRLNDFSKLHKKTRAAIIAAHRKSDPDWRFTAIRIFVKQQCKTSTFDGQAKAVQTIANMSDVWMIFYGPTVRYMQAYDDEHRPKHIFLLCGNTPKQMDKWAKKYIRGRDFTTNDYTAFDQSQAGEALNLEVRLMTWHSIPQHIIDMYIWQKTHASHQYGVSAIMRFSGEPATLFFNTLFSRALAQLQYIKPPGNPEAYSGDDSLLTGFLQETELWALLMHQFKVVAKTEWVSQPIFCGFIFSCYGIIREPKTIGIKLAIAQQNEEFFKVAVSYAHEFAVGHALGDLVWSVLTPEQLDWHFAVANVLFTEGGEVVRSLMTNEEVPLHMLPQYMQMQMADTTQIRQLATKARLEAYRAMLASR
jgi:hypothetical protein